MISTGVRGLGFRSTGVESNSVPGSDKEKEVAITYVASPEEENRLVFPGAYSHPIFDAANTPVNACSAMFNIFFSEDYPQPGVHDDNEGFYVISGAGKMMVNGEEYDLKPGCAMYAPAGMPHAIRKVGIEDLHVFLYHFPK